MSGNPANSCIMVVLGHGICLGIATFVSADLGEKKYEEKKGTVVIYLNYIRSNNGEFCGRSDTASE